MEGMRRREEEVVVVVRRALLVRKDMVRVMNEERT